MGGREGETEGRVGGLRATKRNGECMENNWRGARETRQKMSAVHKWRHKGQLNGVSGVGEKRGREAEGNFRRVQAQMYAAWGNPIGED